MDVTHCPRCGCEIIWGTAATPEARASGLCPTLPGREPCSPRTEQAPPLPLAAAILIILEESDVAVVEMHQRSNGVLVVCDGDDAAIALAKAATKHSVTAGRTGAMVYLKA